MTKSSKKRRTYSIRNFLVIVIVFLILSGIYYYVNVYMHDPEEVFINEAEPEYRILENTDSLQNAIAVMYTQNTNINDIANTFYKSNIFWPYIFIENRNLKEVAGNPLDIPKGIVLKIPRMPLHLTDPNNSEAVERAKYLADSILNTTDPTN